MRHCYVSPAPAMERDARASARPPVAGRMRCLSIAHKTRTEALIHFIGRSIGLNNPEPKPRTFKVWEEGSIASFPGIPHQDPGIKANTGDTGGIRGVITSLSDASRRNLMRFIAKMRRDAEGYTMALTLPGDFEPLPPVAVHECFKILCNRFTASGLFSDVSFIWKRELQKRGALHYHLLIFGLEDERLRQAFQDWMASQWNELVCVHVTDKGKADHLWWHLRKINMQKRRGDFEGYFAKYLGKDVNAARMFIPGRWWGKVNGKALPLAECRQEELPDRMAVYANRIARKLRQKRADEAKHQRIARELGAVDFDKKPYLSQFGLIRMKGGHLHPEDNFGVVMLILAEKNDKRWGKFRPRRIKRKHQTKQDGQRILAAKYAGIDLISALSPQSALRIMKHARERYKDWLERHPPCEGTARRQAMSAALPV